MLEDIQNKEEKEIGLKSLFIIFIIGVAILGGLFYSYRSNAGITGEVILESGGEIITIDQNFAVDLTDSTIIEDFENSEGIYPNDDFYLSKILEFHYNDEATVDLSVVPEASIGNKSLELKFNYNDAEHSWLLVRSKGLDETNWENYNFINMIIKSDGKNSKLRLIVYDLDNNEFGYEDHTILDTVDWTLLKIPMFNVVQTYFTAPYNGERDLSNVSRYELHFINPTQSGDRRILIDSIFLSK